MARPRRGYARWVFSPKTLRTHGMTGTPEYRTWINRRRVCIDPKHKDWKHYGGRGIRMCDRWLLSFADFLADILAEIGPQPPGKTLDRIDNNGNYEPGNVKWATVAEQRQNRRCEGMARGSRSGQAKLTEAQVARILQLYNDKISGPAQLARRYHVTPGLIAKILRGEYWTHVPGNRRPPGWTRSIVGMPRGVDNARAKLTPAKVCRILQLAARGVTKAELARRYGVTWANVHHIIARRIWRHLSC